MWTCKLRGLSWKSAEQGVQHNTGCGSGGCVAGEQQRRRAAHLQEQAELHSPVVLQVVRVVQRLRLAGGTGRETA